MKVDIQHDGGWWSRYGHLGKIYVRVGANVTQGQTIGTCDNSGNSTGPHLHLEIKKDGAYVDPLLVLG
jgi:murein DD-endopeptidase MepM/ murein hydrolase activator NlpD